MGMGRPRAFDADAALDRAMDVFWRHGYEGATIAQLTEAMSINPPSLYAAFGSKEGLLKAALDRYSEKRDAWMDRVVSAPTAHEVAERFLMEHADAQTDPANPPGCLLVQGGLACGTGSEIRHWSITLPWPPPTSRMACSQCSCCLPSGCPSCCHIS